jgi:hypothetical protein
VSAAKCSAAKLSQKMKEMAEASAREKSDRVASGTAQMRCFSDVVVDDYPVEEMADSLADERALKGAKNLTEMLTRSIALAEKRLASAKKKRPSKKVTRRAK